MVLAAGKPDEPVTISKSTPASWHSNTWRAGLGLDWQRGSWVVGIAADMSRDFSGKNPESDALAMRAGVSYLF